MIIYLANPTFDQTIAGAIEETEQIVFSKIVENDVDFAKYIKTNIAQFGQIDMIIVDLSACRNTDEEIIKAVEMVRSMYDNLRIIIFAAYKKAGDDVLLQCCNMGIWNIITTDDFREIREELIQCITVGKTFSQALKYKDAKTDVTIKHEKKTVYKKLIAVAGSETNIGVTHNAIVLANYLRKKGFMVALAEMNDSVAFEAICKDYDEKQFAEGYYTMGGVDYWPAVDTECLVQIMEHSYNFIVLDMGAYTGCDRIIWEKADEKIIISGSKAWEMDQTNSVFANASQEALKSYIFCFNFTQAQDYDAIREGMRQLKRENVHFLKYLEDPFSNYDFSDGDEIFANYLPDDEEPEETKKSFFKRMRKNGQNQKKQKDTV